MVATLEKASWRRLVAKETLAGLALGVLYPWGLASNRVRRNGPPCETRHTVVLVHGMMANRTCFLPLIAYLKVHGVKNVVCYQYKSSLGAEQAALGLRRFLKKDLRGGRVDLVCHSMGGLVARVFIQMLGGHRSVDRCVFLGSPHAGTYNAFWLPTRVGLELRPDSTLLQRLCQTRDEAAGVEFVSVSAESDNIILPRQSANYEGFVSIAGTGHLGLLFSPQAMRTVLNFLRPRQSRAS